MLLAIDQGNTNTVFALIDADGAIHRKWRIATDDRRTADEYLVWIHALFALEGWGQEGGADGLVNAVAAREICAGARIVIDFGTATTFDVVAADGGYEGGVIAPGINLSLKALHEAAAKLPRIAVEAPKNGSVVGRSTLEAMQSGVFWGYVALIEGLVARIRAERDEPMTVIATGGLAAIFEPHTKAIELVDHDLTIRGLARIYQHNRARG